MKLSVLLLILLSSIFMGCSKSTHPSVLLILTDDLSFTDTPCNTSDSESSLKGFNTLCDESVRFTHAYSPSPMSAPAIASILTGLYPYEHGLRHNGSYLRPEIETIPELYLAHGYRTAFFSGGAPVLRKSGLNQGYEVFEDFYQPTAKKLFRSFAENATIALDWIRTTDSEPFFITIYAPDLIFTNTLTTDESGELRNYSYESQLEEFNNQLNKLIVELKKRNRWDNLNVVLAGLNGQTESNRTGEIPPLNLHSENSQVTLLIKPAGKSRDLGLHWKFDKNVSLTDVGETLKNWLGPQLLSKNNQRSFPVFTLDPILKGEFSTFSNERPLLVESAWSEWRYQDRIRYGVIKAFSFLIYDAPQRQFNTLVDRFELSPLPINENFFLENSDTFKRLQAIDAKPWNTRYPKTSLKYKVPFQKWMRNDQGQDLQKDLQAVYADTQDGEVANWLANIYTENKNWAALLRLGLRNDNALWITASSELSGQALPKHTTQDHCFSLLQKKNLQSQDLKTCADKEFIDFLSWIRAEDLKLNIDRQKNHFVRNFWYNRINKTIAKANIAMGGILDTNTRNALRPSRTELAIQLESMKRFRVDVNIELEKLDQQITPLLNED